MASDQKRVRVSLSGKPLVGEALQSGAGAESQCWPYAPSDGPLGSTRGIKKLRGLKGLGEQRCHALLVPVPEIKR